MSNRTRDKRLVKPRKGHPPDILRKGGSHRDRTKYDRKQKGSKPNDTRHDPS